MTSKTPPLSRRAGFAIVVVLAAVVLLVGVALAFFSNAMLQKQISQSSASRVKTDIFAQGAVDTIVTDFKAEIKAGSTVTNLVSGTATATLYFPLAATNVSPVLVGSTGTNGLENLIKRSTGSAPFYAGAANRASSFSSTNAALGGRAISMARWNKPFLLPATSATDPTPSNSAGFVAPDWVFVARDGSHPTTWSDALKASRTNQTAVVGRYAYAIYDEGGLLDVNVAGSLSTQSATNRAQKGSEAYADLAVLFETAGFTSARATQIVDALVTWRNEATLQGGGVVYDSWAVRNPKGFLSTANTYLANGKSDRIFTSRQQLQKFLLEKAATSTEQDKAQKALTYLATFTRDINEPALVKAQSVNSGFPGYSANAPQVQTIANGENNQSGLDALVNPPFPLVRVKTPFIRNNGTTAQAGEPLVRERFALSRLAWLTYKGPSAARNQSDPDMQALINMHGVPWSSLQQGTAANIQKYFGLRWVPDAGSDLGVWMYDVHNGATGSGPTGPILRLGAPGDSAGLANLNTPREPDFFELLKATIHAGSKAKAASTFPSTSATLDYQAQKDVSFDAAIVQIGANIIAQSRVDGFGLRIQFNDGTLGNREIYGVVNNPYFYRARWGVLKIRRESPVFTGNLPLPNAAAGLVVSDTASPQRWGTSQGTLVDPGVSLVMLLPEIWNPHDQNSPAPAAGLRPGTFRIVADSADPDSVFQNNLAGYGNIFAEGRNSREPGGDTYSSTKAVAAPTLGQPVFSRARGGTGVEITGGYAGYQHPLTAQNTAMTFSATTASLFREPTLLARSQIPAGSNLRMASSGWDAGSAPQSDYLALETTSGPSFVPDQGFTADVTNPLALPTPGLVSAATPYVGIPISLFPSAWIRNRNAGEPNPLPWGGMIARSDLVPVNGTRDITFRMQYQDPTNSGNWITYDVKYIRPATTWFRNVLGNSTGGLMQSAPVWATFTDPRTGRFGGIAPNTAGGANSNTSAMLRAPGAAAYANPTTNDGYGRSESTPANSKEWLDEANNVLISQRPTSDGGVAMAFSGSFTLANPAAGWQNPEMLMGAMSQNVISLSNNGFKYSGAFTSVANTAATTPHYYQDSDNVVRRAAGAYATAALGLPMATTVNPGGGTVSGQAQSRPWMLQRPFRSVAELGYVFSDTPWKNLDFFTPESGDGGLLDVFCINETNTPNALVAGKLNLNTRQMPVLKAVMAGAYRTEQTPVSPVLDRSAGGVTEQIAAALVKRTITVSGTSGKLSNPSELVGRWIGTSNSAPIDGSAAFDGFSKDLGTVLENNFGPSSTMTVVQRFRESAIRPLASVGTTRVWNVMIDLVAQTGKFPDSATDFTKFGVDGEARYWVHLAIDRLTGEVVDRQIEVVKE